MTRYGRLDRAAQDARKGTKINQDRSSTGEGARSPGGTPPGSFLIAGGRPARTGRRPARPILLAGLVGTLALAVLWLVGRGYLPAAQADAANPAGLGAPADPGPAGQSATGAPAWFVENVGQFEAATRFRGQGSEGVLQIADEGFWLTVIESPATGLGHPLPRDPGRTDEPGAGPLGCAGPPADCSSGQRSTASSRGVHLHFSYTSANPRPRIEGIDRRPTAVSYFLGHDPARWRADAPVWDGVRYVDIYPGVDLEISAEGGRYTQRFIVRDRTDQSGGGVQALQGARLRVEGATALALSRQGALDISTDLGNLSLGLAQVESRETAAGPNPALGAAATGPVVEGLEVAYPFAVNGAAAGSPRDALDQPSRPGDDAAASQSGSSGALAGAAAEDLVYATFLGDQPDDVGRGIAVDSAGNAYVAGSTYTPNFPTTAGAFQTTAGGSADAFVAKLNATGSGLIYATYLGGADSDQGHGIAVDGAGQAYLTGETRSIDFPATAPVVQPARGDGESFFTDAFVVKLNAAGTGLIYGTYLGGSNIDRGLGIAVDAAGNAYLAGETRSADFPATPGAYQTVFGGFSDAFLAKLTPLGDRAAYATYLGGANWDGAAGVAVDGADHAYLTGSTLSGDFPTMAGAFQRAYGGAADAFVAKLTGAGDSLAYSTYLGGTGGDGGTGIVVDAVGQASVTGWTHSTNFPATAGAFQMAFGGQGDAFVAKLTATEQALALVYASYLGGSGSDRALGIALDQAGNAHVIGETYSTNFPVTPGAFQTSLAGPTDAFVAQLGDPCGRLAYATYLGGTVWDQGNGIAVDGRGQAYLTGYTQSANFPVTTGAFQTTYGGGPYPVDGFAAKLFTGDSPSTEDSPVTATRTLVGTDPSAERFQLYLPAVYRPIGPRC